MYEKTSPALLFLSPALALVPPYYGASFLVNSEDSAIEMQDPDSNRNAAQLGVRRAGDTAHARKSYVLFDVSSVDEPSLSGGFSFSATTHGTSFLIGAANGVISVGLYGIVDGDDSWSETDITWNNAPKNLNTAGTFAADGVIKLATVEIDTDTLIGNQEIVWLSSALDEYVNWGLGLLGDHYDTEVSSRSKLKFMPAGDDDTADGSRPGVQFTAGRRARKIQRR